MSSVIYLLRHAEIERTSPRRFLGQSDIPLNQSGIDQARRLRAALAAIPFARIVASPLKRAMQTAMLATGCSPADIEPVPALREIDLGAWEGLTVAEVQQRFPGGYEERGRDLARYRPAKGESFADLSDRALPALLEIGRFTSGPILVVAHAGVNRVLLCHLLQRPLAQLLDIPQEYACINILHRVDDTLQVRAINQSAALVNKSLSTAI